jgi:4-hydroxybenzoate polyprenyltransferase
LFWVSGFDIIYSLQDEEFDSSNNLYSIPSFLGKKNALLVSRLLHLTSTGFVVAAGIYGHFGFIYWIGAAFFLSMLIYQHSLVKPTDLSRVNLAFATTNGVASVVFGCFVVAALLVSHL